MTDSSEQPKLEKPCPPCKTGPGLWMATFADMAILLMAMFVLLIALAETAKQRNTMFSIPGDNQSAFGTQDIIESDLAPSGYQGAETSADTNEGYEQVVKALAKEIEDGRVKVKIPPGSQNGDQFRLSGKGMPTVRSTHFGDMIISLSVEIPKNLSEKQKKLLREFNEELTQKNSPESSGFFSKVKDFWEGLT